MDGLISTVNNLIDNAMTVGMRLLELPLVFLWLIGLVALSVGTVGFLWLAKKLRRGRALRFSWRVFFVVASVLLILLLIDQKFRLVINEVRGMRAEGLRRSTVVRIVGQEGNERSGRAFLFPAEAFRSQIEAAYPGAEVSLEPDGPAIDYGTIRLPKPHDSSLAFTVIDLSNPDLDVVITEAFENKWLTSAFAEKHGCAVAINGEAGLSPALNSGLGHWTGNWVVRGEPILLEDTAKRPFLGFDRRNRPRYSKADLVDTTLSPDKFNAIWGRFDLILEGVLLENLDEKPGPRTCMGIDREKQRLYLVVVDGRRPGHSLGLGLQDVGAMMVMLGAHEAMSCDQGGSSCLYLKSRGGLVTVPSDGKERPTYSHFGVRLNE